MAPRIWSWREFISKKLITGRAGRPSGSSHAQGPSAIAACWRAPGWRVALDVVFLQHFGHGYFHARVAAAAADIVAVGQGIVTGQTGWIGSIIVRPDARRRGLGSRMTQEVTASLRRDGCSSLLLVATPLGEPVYRRLGFRKTADYVFMDVPRLPPQAISAIRRLGPADVNDVLGLDATATGETRTDLVTPHLASGWVHIDQDGLLDGYVLPSLGAALVIAQTPVAGLALLRFKHACLPGTAVVPAANTAALEFLLTRGAKETARAPRMALGDEADWRPEWIYPRAAGYCG